MSLKTPLFSQESEWPISDEADVVVVGAGPGGFAAAVAAARLGRSVILLDQTSAPGGLSTNAMIPNIMGMGSDGKQICAGIAEDLILKMGKMNHAYQKVSRTDKKPIEDTEAITCSIITSVHGTQIGMLKMLDEAKVRTRFYTTVLGAVVEDGYVKAVAVNGVEGLGLIKGKVFVDASGDAHLVHRAGGQTVSAEADEAMTKTLIMDVGGVEQFDGPAVEKKFEELAKQKKVPVAIQDKFMGYRIADPSVVQLNYSAVIGDGLDSGEMTRMDYELRMQIEEGVQWFRENIPGFEQCYLLRTPSRIGIRAGRCGVGYQTITKNDIDENTPVKEPVAIGIRRYGDHGIKGFSAGWAKPVSGTRPIPWQTLLQKDLHNVALAGRSISCEPKMQTCIRYMAQCFSTGQAAGVTSAIAVQENAANLIDVDYAQVREILLKQKAILSTD